MQLALQLASMANGQTAPNPLVGAIVVKDGYIVGQGTHLRAGEPHAEVHALRMAGEQARGATMYVTLEPCSHYGRTPPCADAVVAAGVARVVVANTDPDIRVAGRGFARLREHGIAVVTGVLADIGERVNETYFHVKRTGRPFVIWKCAATLDGYIATLTGDSYYVTSLAARDDVQQLRAACDAIAVGIGTALADDPRLTVRATATDTQPSGRQPTRIVFDSDLRLPPSARMLSEPGVTIVFTAEDQFVTCAQRKEKLEAAGATVVSVPRDEHRRVALPIAFAHLVEQGIHSVFLEGGARLASACITARLVDKVVYYMAPKLLGGGRAALTNLGLERMASAISLRDVVCLAVGDDFRVTGYPVYAEEN